MNIAIKLITSKFTYPEYFSPTSKFYESTGIRQKRWWQLYKGERRMTEREYNAVISHLKIDKHSAFDLRQLDLFDNV